MSSRPSPATTQPASAPADAWATLDPFVRTMNRGVALMERYEYAEAAKALEEAIRIAPKSTEARVNLAVAMYNRAAKGDVEQAEKLLDGVLGEEADHPRALYFRGIIHQYSGRDDAAIACFERVLKAAPHDACAWYLLARSKAHKGQPVRAELERAIQENPALVSARYDLMRVAAQEGRMDEAQKLQEEFTRLRQSPLAETVTIPHYRQMGPLAVVQPAVAWPRLGAAMPSPPVTSGELSAGTAKTIFTTRDARSEPERERGAAEPIGSVGSPATPGPTTRSVGPPWPTTNTNGPPPSSRPTTNTTDPSHSTSPTVGRRYGVAGGESYGAAVAFADVNNDGRLDLLTTAPMYDDKRGLCLLLGGADGTYADVTAKSGLADVREAVSCAFGDYDNDGRVDLFVCCAGSNQLFRGWGDGTFEDVTDRAGVAGPEAVSMSAVFLDADHDGDLDIYVCNRSRLTDDKPAANQLLNNNADGTFRDIAKEAGVACEGERSVSVAPADLDGDRDTDLIVFNQEAPLRVFFNDRMGKYHEGAITDEPIPADHGGVAQDFNGDGRVDLLVSSGPRTPGRLYLSDAAGLWQKGTGSEPSTRGAIKESLPRGACPLLPRAASAQFEECAKAALTWGEIRETRVADVDLDGDLDIVLFGRDGHVLLNDGCGRFVLSTHVWPLAASDEGGNIGSEVADLTGDGVPDVIRITAGRIVLLPTQLTPPANWLALTPTGDRGEDQRTRSPASGFGTRVETHCGLHSQTLVYTGLNGGLGQSHAPLIVGLDGASKADYVMLSWPDGVTQAETDLPAKVGQRVRETERRISSCPILFAWNGERFGLVGDFAGVGGLGYFVAQSSAVGTEGTRGPGDRGMPAHFPWSLGPSVPRSSLSPQPSTLPLYAAPQVVEHVKIEPGQLAPRDGRYELRICEPMEEVAYLDRLELLAIDHPGDVAVFPDERLAISGPPPSHKLLCTTTPIFPTRAIAPDGSECSANLAAVDRVYAYQPPLDRRFTGFCRPHALVLDFDAAVQSLPAEHDVYLFLNGSIEYPYSQTTYAASQAGVAWQPLKLEVQDDDGTWRTIVEDAGAPGGIGRTIAIDLGKRGLAPSRAHLARSKGACREVPVPFCLKAKSHQPSAVSHQPTAHDRQPPATQDSELVNLLVFDRDSSTGKSDESRKVHRLSALSTQHFSPGLRLRLTTNLEIYYDQAFIAADRGTDGCTVRTIPLASAVLRRLGFPKEFSPDGRIPTIYDYDTIEPTSSFKMLRGRYTRFGPVEELLTEFDDRYVIFGTGDEIAVSFDADALPKPPTGFVRSFVLVSHAYCKDMDLYTAEPDTVEPWPFRDMPAYPPPASVQSPREQSANDWRQKFNTREVR